MATPTWSAARNGLPGDTNAVDASAQVNQLLGTHGVTPIYAGNPVVVAAGTGSGSDDPTDFWPFHLDVFDYDQPFTMSGTKIGRVLIPILPVGMAADVKVSLCADSAGSPGTVLASTRIPAAWINAFAAYRSIAAPSTPGTDVILEATGSPLALAQYNPLQLAAWNHTVWTSPAVGTDGGAGNPAIISNGNYLITTGGTLPDGVTSANSVFTVAYSGSGSQLGDTIPQPVIPRAVTSHGAVVTDEWLLVAGGQTNSTPTLTSSSYVASWDPETGVVGAWSAQAALPQTVESQGCTAAGNTVYLLGGQGPGPSFSTLSVVWYATIDNGQITSWNIGPSLPVPLFSPSVAVVNGNLIAFGGELASNAVNTTMYYAPINGDGSLGSWQTGPPPTLGVLGFKMAQDSTVGLVQVGGFTNSSGSLTDTVQSLTVDSIGGAAPVWKKQVYPFSLAAAPSAMFSTDPGQWELFFVFGNAYDSVPVFVTPQISVPLPVSGLTNGTKYHILIQQQGGDLTNFTRTCLDFNALPGNPTSLFRGRNSGGSWTPFIGGTQIPIIVCDQTPDGQVLHTWEDGGKRISTLVWANTPDQRLLAIADSVQFVDGTICPTVTEVTYAGTWPDGAWPPTGTTQVG